MNENPTSIKQMLQGMMPDPPGVLEGTVTNESPLQITLANDAKMVLSQNSIILPDWLTDMEKTIDISLDGGNIVAPTGQEEDKGAHKHEGGEHEGHTTKDGKHLHEDGKHEHYLRNFDVYGATIVIRNHLRFGDIVLLLSFNRGKQYYILDRRG